MSHGIVRRRSMAFSSLHRPAVACASWPSHSHSDTSSRQTLGRRTISTLHPLVLRRLRRSFVLDYSSFSWHWNLSALAATHASIQGPLEAPRPWRQYWQCCQIQDENSRHFWQGPLLRDLDELEPFCRIFRVAEQVHNAVMEAFGFFSQEKSVPLSKLNGQILYGQNGKDAVADLFLVEDKVVSALGLICASLHQQKEEVLEGRLRFGTSVPDSLQPFSQFRAEMHRYCKELEATLCGCFSLEQFKFLHRKLQNLVSVCLDAGYPRTDDEPSHADIPNWEAVHLHLPYYDGRLENGICGLVLWKGGRIIEEGSQWLIDKGFTAIVDLRAEVGVDEHLHSLMNKEVFSGSITQIWLPINQGSCPSKDDIAEFGKLIADPQNHPLYFHSPVGLGQTFSLLSRLRDIISMKAFENSAMITGKPSLESSVPLKEKQIQENSFIANEISMGEHQSKRIGISIKDLISYGLGEFVDFLSSKNPSSSPFEVQRPVSRSLFRHGMSMFMKEGQVASSQSCWKLAKTEVLDFPGNFGVTSMLTNPTLEHSGRCGLEGFGIPRAGGRDDLASGNGHLDMTCGKVGGELKSLLDVNGSSDRSKGSLLRVAQLERAEEEKADEAVVGNMCASTTGVVRLQSRKKAEIYLVRADGFTCTREQVKESTLAFTHPSTQQQMVMWKTTPRTVLLLKKPGNELMQAAQQVASFLHYGEGMNVIVEPEVHDHFARIPGFGFIQTYYNQDASNLHERVDFVVCLGGDGVILHASNLFRNAVPPVVSFNLGSLGFLTAHLFKDFMQDLGAIIHGNTRAEGVYITLRMRLRCELFQNGKPVPGKIFEVLNEVVLDRGSSPYLCKIECYERNRLITKVQADGVIIATPTGSTAYSSSAGGSMVHPNVPCMLFTPICPHSLSFRPVILPDSALLELKVPEDARSNVWVSFDGKKRQQLSRGHSVRICMSEHPLPTVNKSDQTDDWFRSLVRCLYWNERLEQKHL